METAKKEKRCLIDGAHALWYISEPLSNVVMEKHVAEGMLSIVLVSNGSAIISTERMEYPMMPKDIFIMYAPEPYWFQIKPNYQCALYHLCVQVGSQGEFLGLAASNGACLCERLRRLHTQLCHGSLEHCKTLASSFHLLQSNNEAEYQYGQAKLVLFLHRILEIAGSVEAAPKDEIITAVTKYIHHHITEEISLYDLAREAGLSLTYFKIKFKKEMGITPNHYINMCKIARAKRMLARGYSITQTAMALSFNTSSYFSTVFRRYSSYTPRQYQSLVFSEESHTDF